MEFPTFNLDEFEGLTGPARFRAADHLDMICRESGFLVLEGHGVSPELIDDMFRVVRAFFDLPPEEKAKVAAPYAGYPYGWLGPLAEALAASKGEKTPPDLKESFNGGPLSVPEGIGDQDAYDFCYQPTLWPELEGFREVWESYYTEMERLAARVMSAFAVALEKPPTFFDRFIGEPISALRALHYPPTGARFEAGQQRAGAHTDYGSLTILMPQAGSSGLQIQMGGMWVDVPATPGAFVVNIGDLMARWTADRWVSTLHRVVARPNEPDRISLAFFHQPDWEAIIEPLDGTMVYRPVRSGPYLMNKFRSTSS